MDIFLTLYYEATKTTFQNRDSESLLGFKNDILVQGIVTLAISKTFLSETYIQIKINIKLLKQ